MISLIQKPGSVIIKTGGKDIFLTALADKEPNRDDFEANQNQQPKPEKLHDFEFGIERSKKIYNWSAHFILYALQRSIGTNWKNQ